MSESEDEVRERDRIRDDRHYERERERRLARARYRTQQGCCVFASTVFVFALALSLPCAGGWGFSCWRCLLESNAIAERLHASRGQSVILNVSSIHMEKRPDSVESIHGTQCTDPTSDALYL